MIYAYIFVMAGVTYLIRMLPLTLFACLTAMTFPAILYATDSPISAFAGLVVAVIFALKEKSLVTVACFSCIAVFVMERILSFL